MTPFFIRLQTSVPNLTAKMIFSKRRTSYHCKAQEVLNVQDFEFSLLLTCLLNQTWSYEI